MARKVLEVYRITLLSNDNNSSLYAVVVLEVYRITLLSNRELFQNTRKKCFRGLQNYTTLKLIC